MLSPNFDPFPILMTERLTLRHVDENDVNEIFFLRSDKKVLQFLDRKPAESAEDAMDFIKKINNLEKNNEAVNWAITITGDHTLLGTICFWNINKEHYRSEIGYVLHPDFQGKGFMQEAMTVVLKYGFETMKLHSVEANVNPDNVPSIRLLERNHFLSEAYFKENYYFDGKFLDSEIYSLIRNPMSL